jgi:phosphoglycolate phosphatase
LIEIIHPLPSSNGFRCAMFDFDGTLSLVRAGWQQLMADFGVELVLQTPHHEDETQLHAHFTRLVAHTNGQQTINQMALFAAEVAQRGGPPVDPREYKSAFAERLEQMVNARKSAFQRGEIDCDSLLVPGAIEFLRLLHQRGVSCYLASGTDHYLVVEEAHLLGLEPFFTAIYGARHDAHNRTKAQVAEMIVQQHDIQGEQLIAFGDGYAEIEAALQQGGAGVGVASSEAAPGRVDAVKRQRLIEAGASLIVADFSQGEALVTHLFNRARPISR